MRAQTIVLLASSALAAGSVPLQAQTLFAYANPLSGPLTFADHTWVTDFSAENATCPNPAPNYWYATGGCHPSAGDKAPRPLGQANADLQIANCIAQPNISTFDPGPPTALIRYAIDGVCHQIANRILASTAIGGTKPITVSKANGYSISRFVYGVYGTSSQWAKLRARCGASSGNAKLLMAKEPELAEVARQADVLDKLPVLQKEQINLRRRINAIDGRARAGNLVAEGVAFEVNEEVNASLHRLQAAMTKDEYERFFNWPYGQDIVLANPEIAERVRYQQ